MVRVGHLSLQQDQYFLFSNSFLASPPDQELAKLFSARANGSISAVTLPQLSTSGMGFESSSLTWGESLFTEGELEQATQDTEKKTNHFKA